MMEPFAQRNDDDDVEKALAILTADIVRAVSFIFVCSLTVSLFNSPI